MGNDKDQGFVVKDKRRLFQEESAKESQPKKKEEAESAADKEKEDQAAQKFAECGPLPEATFTGFILSLSSSAFFHLGDLPNPATGKTEKDLNLAKHTIDLLSLIKEKTRGNLTDEEDKLMDHLLYDLRMRYIKEAQC
jgi:hypothetical protein